MLMTMQRWSNPVLEDEDCVTWQESGTCEIYLLSAPSLLILVGFL